MQCLIMKLILKSLVGAGSPVEITLGYKKFFSRVRHAARTFVGLRPTRLHKRAPGEGKTRGSGTEKRCPDRWFHTIFPCTNPYTNNIFSTSPPLPQKPRRRCESGRLFALFEAFRSYRNHFTSFGIV